MEGQSNLDRLKQLGENLAYMKENADKPILVYKCVRTSEVDSIWREGDIFIQKWPDDSDSFFREDIPQALHLPIGDAIKNWSNSNIECPFVLDSEIKFKESPYYQYWVEKCAEEKATLKEEFEPLMDALNEYLSR